MATVSSYSPSSHESSAILAHEVHCEDPIVQEQLVVSNDTSLVDVLCPEYLALLSDSTHQFTVQDFYNIDACLRIMYGDSLTFYNSGSSSGRGTEIDKRLVFFTTVKVPIIPDLGILAEFAKIAFNKESKNTTIHEEVLFDGIETHPFLANYTLKLTIEGTDINLSGTPTLWHSNLNQPREVKILLKHVKKDPDLPTISSQALYFRVKVNSSNPSVRYRKPDETWVIEGRAFKPADSQYCLNTFGEEADRIEGSASASVHILYGNPVKKLLKPLLFLDGIDLSLDQKTDHEHGDQVIRNGTLGWDTFITGLYEDDIDADVLALSPEMIDQLHNEGFDIIFVDFTDGATWIERNGECVISILEKVNEVKESNTQNIVIGASMGGQVARWALATMEKRKIDHCSSVYVSFDSPQKGAHISLGLQALLFEMFKRDKDGLGKAWTALQRPAPQQLLKFQFNHILEKHETPNCVRVRYEEIMAELKYPKMTKNVAIACGSGGMNPVDPPGNNNGTQLRAFYDVGCRFLNIQSNAAGGNNTVLYATPCNDPNSADNIVFASLIPGKHETLITSPNSYRTAVLKRVHYTNSNIFQYLGVHFPSSGPLEVVEKVINIPGTSIDNWDIAPGCVRGDYPNLIKTALEDFKDGVQVPEATNACFMPTVSSLDINTSDLFYNVAANIANYGPDTLLTPFDAVYFTTGENLPHVQITPAIIDFVMSIVVDQAPQPTELTQRYNYAHISQKNVPSTNVRAGGTLVVNGDGNAGFGNITILHNRNHYKAQTGGCGSVTVTAHSGGKVIVGEVADYKARLTINPSHTLHIKSGGILEVNHGSELIIRPGAKLILDPGAIVKLQGKGDIIMEGTLEFKGDVNIQAAGAIRWLPTAELMAEGKLSINGQYGTAPAAANVVLRLMEDARFILSGVDLSITSGAVQVVSDYGIIAEAGTTVFAKHAYFYGASADHIMLPAVYIYPTNTGITANEYKDVILEDCKFTNLKTAVDLIYSIPAPDKVTNFKKLFISGCETGIRARQIGHLIIDNSDLEGMPHQPAHLREAEVGIRLQTATLQGRHLRVRNLTYGTGIDASANNEGGIWKNNIMLTHCSNVSYNNVGVKLDGGLGQAGVTPDWGLFHMSSSTLGPFTDRGTGVLGTDVLLSIDAINNPGQGPNTLLSCHTQQGAGFGPSTCQTLFAICYKTRQPHQILARGNFWGTELVSPGVPKIHVFLVRSITGPNGPCETNVPLIYQPHHQNLTVYPRECTEIIRTEEDPERNPNILGEASNCAGSPISETEQFYIAYAALTAGEIIDGKDGLAPLAYGTSEQDTCGYFRAFAGTQVPREEVWQRHDLPQIAAENISKTEIIIYPQPAGNQLQVDLPQGSWSLELRHASGKVLYNALSVSYIHTLDMSAYTPGVYLLQALSETGQIQTLKIIKQ